MFFLAWSGEAGVVKGGHGQMGNHQGTTPYPCGNLHEPSTLTFTPPLPCSSDSGSEEHSDGLARHNLGSEIPWAHGFLSPYPEDRGWFIHIYSSLKN